MICWKYHINNVFSFSASSDYGRWRLLSYICALQFNVGSEQHFVERLYTRWPMLLLYCHDKSFTAEGTRPQDLLLHRLTVIFNTVATVHVVLLEILIQSLYTLFNMKFSNNYHISNVISILIITITTTISSIRFF